MGSVSARTPSKSNSSASQLKRKSPGEFASIPDFPTTRGARPVFGGVFSGVSRGDNVPSGSGYNSVMINPTEKIWHNGKLIHWNDAKIHVLAHVTSYGSSVFEGVRCYATASGPAIFRAREHARRLRDSARIYRIQIPYSIDEICNAMAEVVRVNKMDACYIRPLVLRGYGNLGVMPTKDNPIETYIACWTWGKYLGGESLEKGVDACVSSWTRMAPNTLPALSKAGGNYMNSQLIRMEAEVNGYSEGIALDASGYVSEGSGENLFLIRDGKLITPPLGASVLPGITRDTVIQIARSLDIPVSEALIPREALYIADEIFFCGTAVEITPVRSVDRIEIGKGKRGPITERLQREFFDIVEGKKADRFGWLSPVAQPVGAAK
jgi:branched-chain amino acid aminotransferase